MNYQIISEVLCTIGRQVLVAVPLLAPLEVHLSSISTLGQSAANATFAAPRVYSTPSVSAGDRCAQGQFTGECSAPEDGFHADTFTADGSAANAHAENSKAPQAANFETGRDDAICESAESSRSEATAVRSRERGLPVVGAVELATVGCPGLRLEARIDTGLKTTIVHVDKLQLLEKDGEPYVRFNLTDPNSGEKLPIEKRVQRRLLVRSPGESPERRLVVKMWIALGEIRSRVDLALSVSSETSYPIVIGRNLLMDTAIVDVSRRYALK